jgi:hypothetical protein
MTSIVNSVTRSINNYWDAIPTGTKEAAFKASIIGFTVAFLDTSMKATNLKPCLMIGAFWATATALHGLAAPFFKRLSSDSGYGPFFEAGRGALALFSASYLAKTLLGYNIINLNKHMILFAVNIIVKCWDKPQRTDVTRPLVPSNV